MVPYANPYWSGAVGGYNDSQPVPVAAGGAPTPSEQATTTFNSARQSFKAGDYPTALSLVELAIADQPTDAAMHEFRALVLFSLGNYARLGLDHAVAPLRGAGCLHGPVAGTGELRPTQSRQSKRGVAMLGQVTLDGDGSFN
ncbi:MAG TPA: hypothetical protein VMV69_06945 [Pirellulales bacterium]|nr:hypothetical protein [Pirellulales bacterium]